MLKVNADPAMLLPVSMLCLSVLILKNLNYCRIVSKKYSLVPKMIGHCLGAEVDISKMCILMCRNMVLDMRQCTRIAYKQEVKAKI